METDYESIDYIYHDTSAMDVIDSDFQTEWTVETPTHTDTIELILD